MSRHHAVVAGHPLPIWSRWGPVASVTVTQEAEFNIGIKADEAAELTIFHGHVRLIPRRVGDVEHPRGGVRGVVPGRQDYR